MKKRLTNEEKEIIDKLHLSDVTCNEIARVLSRTRETVKSYLFRNFEGKIRKKREVKRNALTNEEKELINELFAKGCGIMEISRKVNRNRSTINKFFNYQNFKMTITDRIESLENQVKILSKFIRQHYEKD